MGALQISMNAIWAEQGTGHISETYRFLVSATSAYAATYIDDIVTFTKTWHQHIQTVKAIPKDVRAAEMTANPMKCVLADKETKYLGFLVGQGIIKSLTEKVEAMCQFQAPKTRDRCIPC